MKRRFWLTSALVALTLTAGPTFAASLADDGWLPFQGCWRAVDAPAGSLLCIVADGEGVRMVELLSGETVRETRLVADDRDRPVSREGCTGTETAGWSADSRRLYMTTELKCGQQIARNSAGIFAFVTPTEWVSIQAVLVDQESAVRTVRYQLVDAPTDVPAAILNSLRANRLARDAARQFASAPLTISDVRDAADHVHGRAVEAMILERKQKFDLDGKKLVALSKAGLDSYLIDAMIAVSNPQRFAVRDARRTELAEVDVPARGTRSAYCEEFWYSRYCDEMYYGDRHRYGYSPFGYYYNDFDYRYSSGFGYYNRPPVIIVVDDDDDRDEPRHGRVTRRGYSNGSPASSGSGSERSGSERSSADRAGSASSSSGASQSTTSSGSSDSGSDRGKAKPRGSGSDDSSSSTSARSSSSSAGSSSSSPSSSAQPRASSTGSSSSSGSTTSSSSSSADDRGKAKPKTGGN